MTGEVPRGLPPSAAAAIRDALDAERQDTLTRITALRREFNGIVESSAGVATDDEHDPEGATIAFERAQLAALLDQANSHPSRRAHLHHLRRRGVAPVKPRDSLPHPLLAPPYPLLMSESNHSCTRR